MAKDLFKMPSSVRVLLLAVLCAVASFLAAAQSGSTASDPVPINSKVATRLLLNQVKPEYPPLARLNYIQGQVQMEVTVARDGRVRKAHVLHGHPFLAASALEAIRRWVYRPFVTKGGPTGFDTDIDVNFNLRQTALEHIPPQPEQDLKRQVRPPEVLAKPAGSGNADSSVRLRVLVNEKGEAIDSTPLSGPVASFEEAQASVRQWKFEPARWGNFRVPWYVEVDVTVKDGSADQAQRKPASQ